MARLPWSPYESIAGQPSAFTASKTRRATASWRPSSLPESSTLIQYRYRDHSKVRIVFVRVIVLEEHPGGTDRQRRDRLAVLTGPESRAERRLDDYAHRACRDPGPRRIRHAPPLRRSPRTGSFDQVVITKNKNRPRRRRRPMIAAPVGRRPRQAPPHRFCARGVAAWNDRSAKMCAAIDVYPAS